jgi:membrane protein CcdC involved in cytochrome C biogenesis
VNAKSFAKIVVGVLISAVVATLLLGGAKDVESFKLVGSLIAFFWVIPAILVITLYRSVQMRDHGR